MDILKETQFIFPTYHLLNIFKKKKLTGTLLNIAAAWLGVITLQVFTIDGHKFSRDTRPVSLALVCSRLSINNLK